MTHLLDGNVLVALAVADHVHHDAALRWWGAADGAFATCPITQGTLVRLLVRQGLGGRAAVGVLGQLTRHGRHRFWPDTVGYDALDLGTVAGHGQVTDAYLAALARHRRGRLATFDRGLVGAASDIATLVPAG
ncbi:MAG: TA system VapC family ribonuclease toxin [Candidatus Dormiibacterota bacterium]